MVERFDQLTQEQLAQAGGKGSALARMLRAGYPVPPGIVILPSAFAGEALRPEAWAKASALLAGLGGSNGTSAYAVRSSALNEDGVGASFAGEFESVLDVRGDEAIQGAIETVRRSRAAERAAAYSQAHHLNGEQEMAVVVQQMVQADLAGVLFTADPLTGSRQAMTGNFVHGTGERLVAGEVNPETFTLARPSGRYAGPPELRPVARELYRLALRLEDELSAPQDIEWAVAGGRIFILQARPITSLSGYNAAAGGWNDSLAGDFLWSNGNFGEALPGVMTPYAWSVFRTFFRVNGLDVIPGVPMGGNLAGRVYVNLSLFMSLSDALHLPRAWFLKANDEMFGRLPPGIRLPTVPRSFGWMLRRLLPWALKRMRDVRKQKERVPEFVARSPGLAADLTERIRAASTPGDLLALWHGELQAHLDETFVMLPAGTSDYKNLQRDLHGRLAKQVGESEANALMSGIDTGRDLASLGPALGLARLARGAMSRADFAQQFGHRGPDELEMSRPGPSEDPAWIDRMLAETRNNPADAEALMEQQRARHREAWERFVANHPRQASAMRRKLDRLAEASHTRESARSEFVRMTGLFRTFALRAAELAGLGDDIFMLTIEEMVALLSGDKAALSLIPARRQTDAQHRALPPYPAIIAGRFDAERWAADPNRRSDWYDLQAASAPITESTNGMVTGFAGAAGVIEGTVRVLRSPEEGDQLQAGEILVTTTTNVGWTPLFPRAGAIVTDVGAPLSHAAIVARELGIPAVVGTGDATMRLKTGDRVRVDGGRGTVELLRDK